MNKMNTLNSPLSIKLMELYCVHDNKVHNIHNIRIIYIHVTLSHLRSKGKASA